MTTVSNTPAPGSLRGYAVRGSLLMIAMRWTVRGIGVVSTVILARLLSPEAFGLTAMATILLAFAEVLTQAGQQLALIRNTAATREHYDTAWTFQVAIHAGLAAALVALAPLAAWLYGDPRPVPLIQVLALGLAVAGLENIGTVDFRKDFAFGKEFRYRVLQKLLAFAATITLALMLRNQWALVGGIVAGQVLATVLSYVVHPFRPRLSVSKRKEIFSFSLWMLLTHVAIFLQNHIDQFLVSLTGNPRALGQYIVASEIASVPTAEIVVPIERALFSVYSRMTTDLEALAAAYLKMLGAVVVVAASVPPGIALLSDDLVALLLGDQWGGAAALIVWLSLAYGVYAACRTIYIIYTVLGHARLTARLTWTRMALIVPFLSAGAAWGDARTIAILYFVGTVLLVPVHVAQLLRVLPVSGARLLGVVWRPVTAALAMALAVEALRAPVGDLALVVRLFAKAGAGAAVFIGTLLGLWVLCGRPDGAEAEGVRLLRERLDALRSR